MTSKEWVKEQLSYTDDHWTTSDRIMLTKILKDLERLEVVEQENKELNDVIEKYNHLNIQSFFIRDREREEIKQLKKAIKILKDNFILELSKENNELYFDAYKCDTREVHGLYDEFFYKLTQQEYELLKEVFENE